MSFGGNVSFIIYRLRIFVIVNLFSLYNIIIKGSQQISLYTKCEFVCRVFVHRTCLIRKKEDPDGTNIGIRANSCEASLCQAKFVLQVEKIWIKEKIA